MLVLSRKKNEQLVFSPFGTIVVVEIRGDKVRLGIEWAKGLEVHREEVEKAIDKENMRFIGLDPSFPDDVKKYEVLKLEHELVRLEQWVAKQRTHVAQQRDALGIPPEMTLIRPPPAPSVDATT